MEPEGSLPHTQVPSVCPYPEPDRSSPCSPTHCLKIYMNIILPSTPASSKWSLSLGFPNQNPVYNFRPVCATCPVLLILLDVITRTILGEEYRSLSSSLCSFLYSAVTSSLLGPAIYTINCVKDLNCGDKFCRLALWMLTWPRRYDIVTEKM
jgi:hypothetical protein